MTEPFSSRDLAERLARIRLWMSRNSWDAFFVEAPANVRYASGFRGEPRALWITSEEALLMTSFRSERWAVDQCPTFTVIAEQDPVGRIAAGLKDRELTIGVDGDIQHRRLTHLREAWPGQVIEPVQGVERIRWTKSEAEIARLRQSQALNERIFEQVLANIRPGMTERGAQGLLLAAMAGEEAVDGPAFTPIVASGPNAWEIHHQPDDTVLKQGDLVIVDLGVKVAGYASDMTRTICLGRATERMKAMHAKVREAQLAGIAAIAPGASAAEVDAAAREVIGRAGCGRGFTHGLGHGIGLETHDAGLRLAPSAGEVKLLPGMVLTVEPGIYIENEFGVRTEDMVVVREEGAERLTTTTHDLIELKEKAR